MGDASCMNKDFAMFNDCLAFIVYKDGHILTEKYFDIWVMREYGVEDSWTKQLVVGPLLRIYKPLPFAKNGELLHHVLSNCLTPLLLNMFFMFLLFPLILCLSVKSLNACIFVLCFCLNFASSRTILVGGRLEWVKSNMVCICYRTVLIGLHLLCQITSPPTSFPSQLFQHLSLIKICPFCGILD